MFFYFIVFLELAAFGIQGIFINIVSKYSGVSYRVEHGPEGLGLEDIRLY